jgi:hypothetical protein
MLKKWAKEIDKAAVEFDKQVIRPIGDAMPKPAPDHETGEAAIMADQELFTTAKQLATVTQAASPAPGSWAETPHRNTMGGYDTARKQYWMYVECMRWDKPREAWIRNLVFYKEPTTFSCFSGRLCADK